MFNSPKLRRGFAVSITAAALAFGPASGALAWSGLDGGLAINGSGPLARVAVTPTLQCNINHQNDYDPEYFSGRSCATFADVDGVQYAPEGYIVGYPGGSSHWTPVSQYQGGAGTAANPYVIDTVVAGGGIQIHQVDAYVNGEHGTESLKSVTNTDSVAHNVTIYHGVDCYLGNDDYGFGSYNPANGAVRCVKGDSNGVASSASRILELKPDTAGSNYYYGFYADTFAEIAKKQPLPNRLDRANGRMDNSMALSWTFSLNPGETKNIAMESRFSALETLRPVISNIMLDPENQGRVTAHVEFDNPNGSAQDLSYANIALGNNAHYVPGSIVGAGDATEDTASHVLQVTNLGRIDANGMATFSFGVTHTDNQPLRLGLEGDVASRIGVVSSTTDNINSTGGGQDDNNRHITQITPPTPPAVHVEPNKDESKDKNDNKDKNEDKKDKNNTFVQEPGLAKTGSDFGAFGVSAAVLIVGMGAALLAARRARG